MPFLLTLVFNWQLCGSIHSHKRKRNNKCGFIIWIQARSGVAHFHKKHPVHSFWHKVVPYIPETMKSETVVKQWKQSCLTLCDPMDCSLATLLHPWDSAGKNTGVGCHALLQGILPTQGSKPGLLHWKQILYHLSHQGSPSSLFMGWRIVSIDTYHLTEKVWQSV